MPTKKRGRGRPKGSEITVIGAIRKRKRHTSGPVVFSALPVDKQQQHIRKWLTGKEDNQRSLFTLQDLVIPLPPQLLDSAVDVTLVKKDF